MIWGDAPRSPSPRRTSNYVKKGSLRLRGNSSRKKGKKEKSNPKPVILTDITAVVREMYRESLRLAAKNAVLSERLAQKNLLDAKAEVCVEEGECSE